jgi:predicted chitinase
VGGFQTLNFKNLYQSVGENAETVREKYRPSLNLSFRKYGLTNYLRQSHFLGQGAAESMFLRSMQEVSMTGTMTDNAMHGTRINKASLALGRNLGIGMARFRVRMIRILGWQNIHRTAD